MLQKLKNLLSHKTVLAENNTSGFEYNCQLDGFDSMLKKMNNYFSGNAEESKLYANELNYLNNTVAKLEVDDRKLLAVIPHPFVLGYDYAKIDVHKDLDAGMFYVLLEGKKLYYHKGYTSIESVQKSYTYVSAEQNEASPHRYIDDYFNINSGDTVADLGAAEGNFSLMVVDEVKALYIFEADSIWTEALEKTFEPWKDKVHIINKFVGSKNEGDMVTLEKYFENKEINALKMDIEGMEVAVLESAETFINQRNLKMAITTYHSHSDAEVIKAFLLKNNYNIVFSNNYMLFVYDNLKPPYFRKAVIKAVKFPGGIVATS